MKDTVRRLHHEMAIDKADQAEEAANEWTTVWNTASPTDSLNGHELSAKQIIENNIGWLLHHIRPIDLASDRDDEDTKHIYKDELKKCAKQMVHSSAGADAWITSELLLMPERWWNALADVWNIVINRGQLPKMWTAIRVVAIPKATSGSRPIATASVEWQMGGKNLGQGGPWAHGQPHQWTCRKWTSYEKPHAPAHEDQPSNPTHVHQE